MALTRDARGTSSAARRADASEAWGVWLSTILGDRWTVQFGRARATPVQARRTRHASELRLHEMFLEAPDDVREALGRWLLVGRRAKRASALLDAWIHDQLARTPAPKRALRLAPQGTTHDLADLAEALCASEFAQDFTEERPRPGLTWGRRAVSRSRRSLRLGSFEPERHVVRVHPVLDQPAVPSWFVRFVLKHELLHAVIPPVREPDGRWVHHGPAFRRRERAWPDYAAAVAWERRNLPRLIRSAREGSALRVRPEDLAAPLPRQGTFFDLAAPSPSPGG
ncbi:MAG: hypothetical protein R3F49_04330 [Planctomycetota bacterium]